MTEPAPETHASAVVPPAPLPSPGQLLRTARERAGLGTEDLAGQLKLAKGTLEALERDDFAALSEPVYIRGYYRKIAKLLTTVSETELIAAYNARCAPPPSAQAAMRRIPLAGGVAAGTSRQYRGQGIWLIVGGVILVGFLFALAGHESPERLKPEPPKAEPTVAPNPEPTPPPVATQIPAPAPTPSVSPPSAPAQTPLARSAPATASPRPAAPQPSAPQASAPHASAPPVATAPPAAAKPAPAPAQAAAKPAELALEFSESSFVRVEDGRGKTLAIGLVRGGERQALDGEPPYTVFIGNAKNVKVFYGGRPVDFSGHVNSQNDTARFTVP